MIRRRWLVVERGSGRVMRRFWSHSAALERTRFLNTAAYLTRHTARFDVVRRD